MHNNESHQSADNRQEKFDSNTIDTIIGSDCMNTTKSSWTQFFILKHEGL